MADEESPSEIEQPERLPAHESAVRRILSDAHHEPYDALRTLAEAQAVPDGAVIFEGDYGGQIYLTCPAAAVRCSQAELEVLLIDVDALAFQYPDSAQVYYERHAPGSGVWGGMGGGVVTDALWVHPELAKANPWLAAAVSDVLAGRHSRLAHPAV